jgi:ribosomal protein S18 acetylase RimI-like enzyme
MVIKELENYQATEPIKTIFLEYAQSLNVDLCFQSFEEELADLKKLYAPPQGCILVATNDENLVGVVALKKIEESVCEMKRLYVKPDFRKFGVGRMLVKLLIERAKEKGYAKMKLDTLTILEPAIALYKSFGFGETTAYYHNPLADVVYMELDLLHAI